MHVHKEPFLSLFAEKQRLEAPLFQRQYVWNVEEQWQPLWEDIRRKFEETFQDAADKKAPQHFLGAVILAQKQTPTGHVVVRQIIDGQQRLTTLQIFIAAYRDFCRENGWSTLAKECEKFLINEGAMNDEAVDKFKVWPTQSDRSQFKNVIDSGSKEKLEELYTLERKKRVKKHDPRPSMVRAYCFFYAQLSDFFNGDESSSPWSANVPFADRIEACFLALRNALMVVIIDLEEGDDPQIIFETLNARGAALLPADLVRNYVFSRAEREKLNVEENYKKYWAEFDSDFWRDPVRQGRLERPRSDLFMQHFLASQKMLADRRARDIPMKRLYAEYRHWIEVEQPFDGVSEELKTVARYGRHFYRLMALDAKDDPIYSISCVLRGFDIGTVYPLLLMMMDADIAEVEQSKITKVLESFIVRRAVCQLPQQNYNLLFLDSARSLAKDGFSAENLRKMLLSKKGDAVLWPDDARFKEAWKNSNSYGMRNSSPKLVYILTRLNQSFMTPKSERITFDEAPSVEHILPQKWQEHWFLPDGSTGMTEEEFEDADDDDLRADATGARNNALNTMGNLTLLSKSLNASQKNSSWGTKLPEMLKHSMLPMNSVLQSESVWDEGAISRRGADLFERAVKIWPR